MVVIKTSLESDGLWPASQQLAACNLTQQQYVETTGLLPVYTTTWSSGRNQSDVGVTVFDSTPDFADNSSDRLRYPKQVPIYVQIPVSKLGLCPLLS